jgi:hypothetical protein
VKKILLAHLKKTPGKVSFASSGNGSSDHEYAPWKQLIDSRKITAD